MVVDVPYDPYLSGRVVVILHCEERVASLVVSPDGL
jgi:hypothetical protein